MQHGLQDILLVGLCPRANRQLGDLHRCPVQTGNIPVHEVSLRFSVGNGPCEPLVPGLLGRVRGGELVGNAGSHTHHFCGFQSIHEPLEIRHNLPRVVVGDGGGVAGPNPITTIDQHSRQDRTVPLGLNTHVVLGLECEQVLVCGNEEASGQRAQQGEYVSGEEEVD